VTNRHLLPLAAALALAACASMAPTYERPPAPVAAAFPDAGAAAGTPAAQTDWRAMFTDARLARLIELALANNRDLRVAVLNVALAKARYGIQDAARLPAVDAAGGFTRQRLAPVQSGTGEAAVTQQVQASVGIAAFELDLFGRVRSLSKAALEQYFAQEAARRGAQLSLVAELADAYLSLVYDRQSLQLAVDTLASQERSLELTRRRFEKGGASGLDVAQASTTVDSARGDMARYEGEVAKDIDALTLLAGAPIDADLLAPPGDAAAAGLRALPPGLPSTVLLRRPDVEAAEHELRAANADIGAARAAFFPAITLTAAGGSASDKLANLFSAGTGYWTLAPQVTLPIFDGGRLRAGLAASTASRDIAVARYEKAVQSAFRDVADDLALARSLARQREAAAARVEDSVRAHDLSVHRYESGRDSYFVVLDSERSSYAARQALIAIGRAEQANRVDLYKALGGGWLERTPAPEGTSRLR
jgi:multidrug efflux system outer membrane protein